MDAWRKVRELVTFTKNEQKIFFFLAVVFLAGAGIKLWRVHTESGSADRLPAFDYRQSDSVFAVRSARPLPAPTDSTAFRIDLNRAGKTELMRLPAVGPTMAGRIIDYRLRHGGRFRSVDELKMVHGIGAKRLATLRPLVTIGRDTTRARRISAK